MNQMTTIRFVRMIQKEASRGFLPPRSLLPAVVTLLSGPDVMLVAF